MGHTQKETTEFEFFAFVDSLFKKLPKNLQTQAMYADLARQANDIIMGLIADFMEADDVEAIAVKSQEEEFDINETMVDYIERNPKVLDHIARELGNFETIVSAFSKL